MNEGAFRLRADWALLLRCSFENRDSAARVRPMGKKEKRERGLRVSRPGQGRPGQGGVELTNEMGMEEESDE